MKRFISFFLTVSLLLTLCSCLATRKIESQKQPISSQDLTHENNEITYTLEYSTDEEIWQIADQDALRLNRTMVAEPGAHNFIYFRVTTNSKLPHFFTFNFKSVNDVLGENLYGEEYYLSEAMKCCLASNSKDHTDIIYDTYII